MLKVIILNLKLRIFLLGLNRDVVPGISGPLDDRSLLNAVNPNEHILDEIADSKHDLIEYFKKIGEVEIASDLFKKSLKVNLASDLFVYQISEFLQDIYDGIDDKRDLDINSMRMLFQKRLINNPNLKDDILFMDYFLFLQDIQGFYKKEEIDRRLREDLEEIVNICRENNIEIIIQDYPYPYPYADRALRDISMKHSLPFVENSKVFSKLLSKGEREIYFREDTHCTPTGYRIMAENIYKVIVSEDIFSNNQEGR